MKALAESRLHTRRAPVEDVVKAAKADRKHPFDAVRALARDSVPR